MNNSSKRAIQLSGNESLFFKSYASAPQPHFVLGRMCGVIANGVIYNSSESDGGVVGPIGEILILTFCRGLLRRSCPIWKDAQSDSLQVCSKAPSILWLR